MGSQREFEAKKLASLRATAEILDADELYDVLRALRVRETAGSPARGVSSCNAPARRLT